MMLTTMKMTMVMIMLMMVMTPGCNDDFDGDDNDGDDVVNDEVMIMMTLTMEGLSDLKVTAEKQLERLLWLLEGCVSFFHRHHHHHSLNNHHHHHSLNHHSLNNHHHVHHICRTRGVEVCNLVDLYEHSVQSATRAFRSTEFYLSHEALQP